MKHRMPPAPVSMSAAGVDEHPVRVAAGDDQRSRDRRLHARCSSGAPTVDEVKRQVLYKGFHSGGLES